MTRLDYCFAVRKLLAILFSLSLVCAQIVAATRAPVVTPPKAICACCDCGSTDCCVTQSSSPCSVPAPIAPVRAGIENQISILSAGSLVWVLPQADASPFSHPTASSLITAAVPLFARHCALLI
jgi:hypothetical protein